MENINSADVSRIAYIIVENFMSIGYAKIGFDEHNVISLCGYNNSGKSAILKALKVLMLDITPNKQVHYIKDGTEYFRVALEMVEGVVISKTKLLTGQSIWEMYNGGKLVYTNKLEDDSVAAITGVPDIIAKYLGLCTDSQTGICLNCQTNKDKIFGIETTGSETYKAFNMLTNNEAISMASSELIKDKNTANSEVTAFKCGIDVITEQLSTLDAPPESEVTKLKDILQKVTDINGNFLMVNDINATSDFISEQKIYDDLLTLDTSSLKALKGILDSCELVDTAVYTELSTLNTEKYTQLQQMCNIVSQESLNVPPEIAIVTSTNYTKLQELLQYATSVETQENAYIATVAEHTKVLLELTELSNQYNFKICKNCGTVVS